MKKETGRSLRKICILAGACLLVAAVAVLLIWQWNIRTAEKRMQRDVDTIRRILPEPQGAVLEERRDNTMSVLSVEGVNFVGILEMPRYGSVLPVRDDWGRLTKCPSHFSGSIYNGTMQIGATTQKGQYDFYREISVGDLVYFTDMEGYRYTYQVTALRYEKHADQTTLQREDGALTLFIKNVYAFEYLIVFCNPVQ